MQKQAFLTSLPGLYYVSNNLQTKLMISPHTKLQYHIVVYINNNGERFEPRSHFLSTVPLKNELTVTHISILKHRDLIFDSQ